jgi:acyl-CoA thioesterase-1
MKTLSLTRVLFAATFTLAAAGCRDAGSARAASDVPVPASQGPDTTARPVPADSTPAILFVGTSLTAGYGLEDPANAFPGVIQQKLDSAGYHFRVLNAGVSGETSAGGLHKSDWLLSRPFRILVLELGANDGLRGLDVAAMKSNLQQFIDQTRAKYPDARIVLAGMEAPPNLGAQYTAAFHAAYRDLAAKNHTALVPFLLDSVAGRPSLNQADGIHPNIEGHRLVAANVWKVLEPVVKEVSK